MYIYMYIYKYTSKCSVSIELAERWCSVLLIRVSMVASLGSNNFCQTNCDNSQNTVSCSSNGFVFHSSFMLGSFTEIVA